jgi:formylglycine-generating enzyme required for sulfatase activity
MAGNEAEWVADWFDANYYSQSVTQNPVGPSAARSSFWSQPAHRVVRGGSWFWGPRSIRVSARSSSLGLYRSAGFRCAREAA